jgi:hypothetical protein
MVEIIVLEDRKCPFPNGSVVRRKGSPIKRTVINQIAPPKPGLEWAVTVVWDDANDDSLAETLPVSAVELVTDDEKPSPKPRRKLKRWPKKQSGLMFTPDFETK